SQDDLQITTAEIGARHDMNGRQLHASRSPLSASPTLRLRQPLPPVIQRPRRHAVPFSKRPRVQAAVSPLTGELQHLLSSILLCLHRDLLRHKHRWTSQLGKDGVRRTLTSMQSLRLGEIVQPSRYAGIVYELKPNVRGRFMGQPLLINSQGLRDYEYTRRKEPGTFRIVGVGDSSLFGWGVPIEDSGLKVLERRLNEEFRARK